MQKRILVVDDDDMNLMRTKRILGFDYDVFFASSGIEALDTLKREEMDLVLLDIEMPKMNGFETFERMKEFAADIPVIDYIDDDPSLLPKQPGKPPLITRYRLFLLSTACIRVV